MRVAIFLGAALLIAPGPAAGQTSPDQHAAAIIDTVETVLATPPTPPDLGGIPGGIVGGKSPSEVGVDAAATVGFEAVNPFARPIGRHELADALRNGRALRSPDGALVALTLAAEPLSTPPCSYEPRRSVLLRHGNLSVVADTLAGAPFEVVGFTKRGVRVRVYGPRCRPRSVADLVHGRRPAPTQSALRGRGVYWRMDAVVSLDGKHLLAVDEPVGVGNQCVEERVPFLCDS